MKTDRQNNIVAFLFLALVGSWLFLVLNRQQASQIKRPFPMNDPASYAPKEPARSSVIIMPHPPGGSIISLN
jgi:hypothetical protein